MEILLLIIAWVTGRSIKALRVVNEARKSHAKCHDKGPRDPSWNRSDKVCLGMRERYLHMEELARLPMVIVMRRLSEH
jgi:hypothetical protein